MTKTLHIIYIPGLGDSSVRGQQLAVNTWRWWGVTPELFQVKWADKEPWKPKFDRLLSRIDELVADGERVALVGASAGASAVINAYAARKDKVVGVVCISGKVNRPDNIREHLLRENPAFKTSAFDCREALTGLTSVNRVHILSRYALADETVSKPDSHIPGARNRLSPTIGHAPTIALQIVFGAPSFIRFLKWQAGD